MPQLIHRPYAILILVVTATLFAGNHISARIAFEHDTGLLLAILLRGLTALSLMLIIAYRQRASFAIPAGQRFWVFSLGILIALQSLCLYSSIVRIPVAMSLLLVNTWPMMFILASWIMGKRQPDALTFGLLFFILVGLALVLDVTSLGNMTAEKQIGIILGLLAALFLAITMWLTQYHLHALPGSVRSAYTMMTVVAVMIIAGAMDWVPGGLKVPQATEGWFGLLGLSILYGIAFTLLFVLAPRLDMGRNSPVLNFEPVASLFLGFVFLGQFLLPMQLVGGAIVIAGILAIGFKGQ
ncbi:DMT family transporter [Bermanella marisrubri]|uniref:EamA domain-containing protein n=1 Tax=Bermanella marisrubri TaxID=207949 RepID=Q1N008_9GAMM|nr:DMT family transporter [Bermanella marisrubri]EAT11555.1 hypothetical protein RED65_02754 [Oceanobacter sp. RED65] [Bermanella marisrubri]QIZ84981.1 DMT family transporter [Bermanella marisrubri]